METNPFFRTLLSSMEFITPQVFPTSSWFIFWHLVPRRNPFLSSVELIFAAKTTPPHHWREIGLDMLTHPKKMIKGHICGASIRKTSTTSYSFCYKIYKTYFLWSQNEHYCNWVKSDQRKSTDTFKG